MRVWLALSLLACALSALASAAEPAKPAPTARYRTDSANEQLPWYQLKPGEFPPQGSAHRVGGELVEADFIHRTGQFRTNGTGELVNFTLLPFATVKYLNAEADLRDLPLGTFFEFFLYQDERGAFTQVALMQDEYSRLAVDGLTHKLDKAKLDQGKLAVIKQAMSRKQADLGHSELLVNDQTHVWKSDKQTGVKQSQLADLAVDDELWVNLTGSSPDHPARCSEIWVGAETQKLATEHQRVQHKAFLKERGLAAWIDAVEGKKVTVTLFGDPAGMAALCKDEGIVPQQWATEHRYIDTVVANDELRTYNPPVDRERSMVAEFQSVPTQNFGSSGIRWLIEPELLLEGFRKGRIVRLFAQQSWPVNDMPFGESLYTESPNVTAGLEEGFHYPYRTDFANENLPWYQLKPGVFPPLRSQHLVSGELLKVDVLHRSGQFRTDRTGELVSFTMPPFGTIMYLNAAAELGDLPLATRYHFFLYQDAKGSFTKAAIIMDDFSRSVANKVSYRIESLKLGESKLVLASQLALVRNEKDAMVRPPDVGRGEFPVDEKTRVWKGDKRAALSDLAVGDELLVNLTGCTTTSRSRSTDIWIGAKTHEVATAQQNAKYHDFIKERGFAGWIESVDGKELTIAFFTGPGNEFQTLMHDGPVGGKLNVTLVDDELVPHGPPGEVMKFKSSVLEGIHAGTYGCRGTQWIVESEKLPKSYHPGQIVRVFDPGWLVK